MISYDLLIIYLTTVVSSIINWLPVPYRHCFIISWWTISTEIPGSLQETDRQTEGQLNYRFSFLHRLFVGGINPVWLSWAEHHKHLLCLASPTLSLEVKGGRGLWHTPHTLFHPQMQAHTTSLLTSSVESDEATKHTLGGRGWDGWGGLPIACGSMTSVVAGIWDSCWRCGRRFYWRSELLHLLREDLKARRDGLLVVMWRAAASPGAFLNSAVDMKPCCTE